MGEASARSSGFGAGTRRNVTWRNWGRNFVCRPESLCRPRSIEEIAHAVKVAREEHWRIRSVGSGYSYTPLVATNEVMLSLDRHQGVEELGDDTVLVRGGTPLWKLANLLRRHNLALENQGDIDRQTVAGLLATGTHGTGIQFGNFSTLATELHIVTATGEVMTARPADDPDCFRALQVSLGALGIIASARIRVVPTYNLRIERRRETFEQALADFQDNVRRNRNYEFFWIPSSDIVYSKTMNRDESGTRVRNRPIHRWFNDYLIENGLVWLFKTIHRRKPHWRAKLLGLIKSMVPDFEDVQPAHLAYATARIVKHQEVEYALPLERAEQVLVDLERGMRARRVQTLMPVEVRSTRKDDIFLSPCYGRDTVFIAVHSFQDECNLEYFQMADEIFQAHEGRPHWGKLHAIDPRELSRRYPRWDDFCRFRQNLDPEGRFENGWLRRIFGNQESGVRNQDE